MKIKVFIYTKNNIGVLEISVKILGDPDADNLPLQVKDLITKGVRNFIFDFTDVKSINSMGIGNIMMCMASIKTVGGQLKLAAVAKKIIDTFVLMEIEQLFEIYEDIEGAVASY